ncbi:MAG: hypothetical protein QW227_03140, partial [Candidatus Aenigmatarchaeota archaeon]
EPSCNDNIKNCHHGSCEILPDCGGPCPPCPTCNDGIKNCHKDGSCEEGIDCGGPCPVCVNPEKPYIACGDGICAENELFTCIKDCYLVLGKYIVTGILISIVCSLLIAKRKIVVIKYKRFKKFLKDDIPDDVHRQIYRENRKRLAELEKKEYMAWAKRNGLSKRLLEKGWKELDFQSDTKDPAQYCYPVEYLKP